jgi:hypothetical protein
MKRTIKIPTLALLFGSALLLIEFVYFPPTTGTASPDAAVVETQYGASAFFQRDSVIDKTVEKIVKEKTQENFFYEEIHEAPDIQSEDVAEKEKNNRDHEAAAPSDKSAPIAATETKADRIEQIANRSGFDWRAHGVSLHIGCSPYLGRCSWGAYDTTTKEIYVSPAIFDRPRILEYVVLHEIAHAWQFNVRGWPRAAEDLVAWGLSGLDGLELAADCLAKLWGAQYLHHGCPEGAAQHMEKIYRNW